MNFRKQQNINSSHFSNIHSSISQHMQRNTLSKHQVFHPIIFGLLLSNFDLDLSFLS
jgi:hypothetical protein